jgi:transaldolase
LKLELGQKMEQEVNSLKIKLFADGADLKSMVEMASKPYIQGLTTNPTLMRKAGVSDYVSFAKSALNEIKDKPISFEVFSDELEEMKIQAQKIASWGENVYVKIPISNTRGESTKLVVEFLSQIGVKVNVTALMTAVQVNEVASALNRDVPSCVSVFAGRIADTGRDPLPIMEESLSILASNPNTELIWASPRELLNVFQANSIGCHIITATNDILAKLALVNKDLTEYSLETVQMFHKDAVSSSFQI